MKKILLIIFILISIPAFSQEYLEGHYYNPQANEYAQGFNFKKDGTFEYYLGDDLHLVILGKGKYKLNDEVLNLYYEQMDTLSYIENQKNTIIILDSSIAEDSVKFRFYTVDKVDKSPLIGAIVWLLDSNNQRMNDITYETNDSGIVEFALDRALYPLILQIIYIGFDDSFFYPEYGFNYDVKFYFSPFSYYSYEFIKGGTVSRFEYEYNTEDSFYIKNINGRDNWTPFTKRERKFDE